MSKSRGNVVAPQKVMAMPAMQEWLDGAKAEPDEVVELDVEF